MKIPDVNNVLNKQKKKKKKGTGEQSIHLADFVNKEKLLFIYLFLSFASLSAWQNEKGRKGWSCLLLQILIFTMRHKFSKVNNKISCLSMPSRTKQRCF